MFLNNINIGRNHNDIYLMTFAILLILLKLTTR